MLLRVSSWSSWPLLWRLPLSSFYNTSQRWQRDDNTHLCFGLGQILMRIEIQEMSEMREKVEVETKKCKDGIKKLTDDEEAEEAEERRTFENLTLGLHEQKNTSKSLALAKTDFEERLEKLQSRIDKLEQDLGKLSKNSPPKDSS